MTGTRHSDDQLPDIRQSPYSLAEGVDNAEDDEWPDISLMVPLVTPSPRAPGTRGQAKLGVSSRTRQPDGCPFPTSTQPSTSSSKLDVTTSSAAQSTLKMKLSVWESKMLKPGATGLGSDGPAAAAAATSSRSSRQHAGDAKSARGGGRDVPPVDLSPVLNRRIAELSSELKGSQLTLAQERSALQRAEAAAARGLEGVRGELEAERGARAREQGRLQAAEAAARGASEEARVAEQVLRGRMELELEAVRESRVAEVARLKGEARKAQAGMRAQEAAARQARGEELARREELAAEASAARRMAEEHRQAMAEAANVAITQAAMVECFEGRVASLSHLEAAAFQLSDEQKAALEAAESALDIEARAASVCRDDASASAARGAAWRSEADTAEAALRHAEEVLQRKAEEAAELRGALENERATELATVTREREAAAAAAAAACAPVEQQLAVARQEAEAHASELESERTLRQQAVVEAARAEAEEWQSLMDVAKTEQEQHLEITVAWEQEARAADGAQAAATELRIIESMEAVEAQAAALQAEGAVQVQELLVAEQLREAAEAALQAEMGAAESASSALGEEKERLSQRFAEAVQKAESRVVTSFTAERARLEAVHRKTLERSLLQAVEEERRLREAELQAERRDAGGRLRDAVKRAEDLAAVAYEQVKKRSKVQVEALQGRVRRAEMEAAQASDQAKWFEERQHDAQSRELGDYVAKERSRAERLEKYMLASQAKSRHAARGKAPVADVRPSASVAPAPDAGGMDLAGEMEAVQLAHEAEIQQLLGTLQEAEAEAARCTRGEAQVAELRGALAEVASEAAAARGERRAAEEAAVEAGRLQDEAAVEAVRLQDEWRAERDTRIAEITRLQVACKKAEAQQAQGAPAPQGLVAEELCAARMEIELEREAKESAVRTAQAMAERLRQAESELEEAEQRPTDSANAAESAQAMAARMEQMEGELEVARGAARQAEALGEAAALASSPRLASELECGAGDADVAGSTESVVRVTDTGSAPAACSQGHNVHEAQAVLGDDPHLEEGAGEPVEGRQPVQDAELRELREALSHSEAELRSVSSNMEETISRLCESRGALEAELVSAQSAEGTRLQLCQAEATEVEAAMRHSLERAQQEAVTAAERGAVERLETAHEEKMQLVRDEAAASIATAKAQQEAIFRTSAKKAVVAAVASEQAVRAREVEAEQQQRLKEVGKLMQALENAEAHAAATSSVEAEEIERRGEQSEYIEQLEAQLEAQRDELDRKIIELEAARGSAQGAQANAAAIGADLHTLKEVELEAQRRVQMEALQCKATEATAARLGSELRAAQEAAAAAAQGSGAAAKELGEARAMLQTRTDEMEEAQYSMRRVEDLAAYEKVKLEEDEGKAKAALAQAREQQKRTGADARKLKDELAAVKVELAAVEARAAEVVQKAEKQEAEETAARDAERAAGLEAVHVAEEAGAAQLRELEASVAAQASENAEMKRDGDEAVAAELKRLKSMTNELDDERQVRAEENKKRIQRIQKLEGDLKTERQLREKSTASLSKKLKESEAAVAASANKALRLEAAEKQRQREQAQHGNEGTALKAQQEEIEAQRQELAVERARLEKQAEALGSDLQAAREEAAKHKREVEKLSGHKSQVRARSTAKICA
ncbi:hypothetical protein CYMTET_23573 [Cymbomonas tetramitiformis]|uniref:Uncharacterized protein n=1 Tax=Cymbomonas tetramitiformis TaxID=36881 RepID=A0AAE0FZ19_9CHLO|nr:hypothetical protein CYMTET_23573 [Cymbomonas tetramitiformis]